MMKKSVFCIVLSVFLGSFLFAQSSADDASAASKQTAAKYAEVAKDLISGGFYIEALENAGIGIAYNDSLSDLWYAKAFCESKLSGRKDKIYEYSKKAYECDNWDCIQKQDGLILYSGILLETNRASLAGILLENVASTAETDCLKAKCSYLCDDYIKARKIITAANKIYPNDYRFPLMFFKWESRDCILNGAEPDEAQTEIAGKFISDISKWQKQCPEIIFYASFLTASQDESDRLLKQYISEENYIAQSIRFALKRNLISEQTAFDKLKKYADDCIDYQDFVRTVAAIKDKSIKKDIKLYLANFKGIISRDYSGDFVSDFFVQYLDGRPCLIEYDSDQDDIDDWACSCAFTGPVDAVVYNGYAKIIFDDYPYVKDVILNNNTEFQLIRKECSIPLASFNSEKIVDEFSMLIPVKSEEYDSKSIQFDAMELMKKSYEIRMTLEEGPDTFVKEYFIENALPKSIKYYKNGVQYAYAVFNGTNLFSRTVDIDYDGIFELTEYYEFDPENKVSTEKESEILYKELFGTIKPYDGLYLSSLCYDRTGDEKVDCREEFFENGKRVTWYDEGKEAIIYEKQVNSENMTEEKTTFINSFEKTKVYVFFENRKPVKVIEESEKGQKEQPVNFDSDLGIFWIGEAPELPVKNQLRQKISFDMSDGDIKIYDIEDSQVTRIQISKIGENIFAQVFKK